MWTSATVAVLLALSACSQPTSEQTSESGESSVECTDKYLVYVWWRSDEDFQNWMSG